MFLVNKPEFVCSKSTIMVLGLGNQQLLVDMLMLVEIFLSSRLEILITVILDDGSISCWGRNNMGQLVMVLTSIEIINVDIGLNKQQFLFR